ncbi:TPA: hypothetical protein ACKQBZ_003322 [Stenotrophomonas maltophilia]|nr:hypothetical protein [Stenotrophomonas maltophilia]HDS1125029.1 hypothetical protein [Stenotrophomonas maltophilia]
MTAPAHWSYKKKFLFWFLIPSVLGLSGGILALAVAKWIPTVSITSSGDAISVANTYIVFTTIIFVGLTIVITVAGIVFAHQFSATKDIQLADLADQLKNRLETNEKDCSIAFMTAALQNPDTQQFINNKLKEKAAEIMNEMADRANQDANDAEQKANGYRATAQQASRFGGTFKQPNSTNGDGK